jgi:mannose-6-phosphate isomerase-like protein (cupin superfamily)
VVGEDKTVFRGNWYMYSRSFDGMVSVVDLGEIVDGFTGAWSPVDVAAVNDQVVRAALFDGEYHWHKHSEEDELFLVYKGSIRIELKNEVIKLDQGQLCVIPKGIEHRPVAEAPSVVLLFEPSVLKSRGD